MCVRAREKPAFVRMDQWWKMEMWCEWAQDLVRARNWMIPFDNKNFYVENIKRYCSNISSSFICNGRACFEYISLLLLCHCLYVHCTMCTRQHFIIHILWIRECIAYLHKNNNKFNSFLRRSHKNRFRSFVRRSFVSYIPVIRWQNHFEDNYMMATESMKLYVQSWRYAATAVACYIILCTRSQINNNNNKIELRANIIRINIDAVVATATTAMACYRAFDLL